MRDVEVNAGDVSEVAAVLVALEKEVPAVIVIYRWTARVMVEDEVGVLIRLRAGGAVGEQAVARNRA